MRNLKLMIGVVLFSGVFAALVIMNLFIWNWCNSVVVVKGDDKMVVAQAEQQYVAEVATKIENQKEPLLIDLGEYTITHYCPCEKCCGQYADGITATGTKATEGRTVAVDKSIIPLGSRVLIDGVEYVAEDVGGAIKGKHIDVYLETHERALNAGKRKANVCVMK